MPSQPTDQWLRKVSLVVLDSTDPNSGAHKFTDFSQFRIRFQVHQADPIAARPPWAIIRVYNLAPQTEQTAIAEYHSVVLQAGYQTGQFGVIFSGTIKQWRRGHESTVDTFLDIFAANDLAFNFAAVNKTLAAGSNAKDYAQTIIDAANKYGLQEGYNSITQGAGGIDQNALAALSKSPRGTTMWGMAQKELTDTTTSLGTTWSIDVTTGKVNIVPLTGYLPGQAVQLNARTGLVYWPEQTQDGILVRCLLNPAIRCMGLVQINNAAINTTFAPGGNTFGMTHFPGETDITLLQPVSYDGFYRVLVIEHEGDTRGNPWYTNLTCVLADVSQERAAAQAGSTGVNDNSVPVPQPLGGELSKSDVPDTAIAGGP